MLVYPVNNALLTKPNVTILYMYMDYLLFVDGCSLTLGMHACSEGYCSCPVCVCVCVCVCVSVCSFLPLRAS